ncbi:ABC transporter permease [Microbacterium sp. HJ5]
MHTASKVDRVRRVGLGNTVSRWDMRLSPYLFISPFFVLFAVTGLFPLVFTAFVSVHEWDLIGGKGDFVGLENYAAILGQDKFWISLRNTFSIFLLSSVPQISLAIIIAAVLDANLRAKTFWRMGVLLPYVVTPVAVTLIFSALFADQSGLVNNILGALGIPPVGWHSEVLPSHIAIASMINFRWTGYNALILLAAMQAIPRDFHEAAMIDGAGPLRRLISVTIPQLRPTIIFVVITSTIGGLQIFEEAQLFSRDANGGADSQWLTITMYLYQLGWRQLDFGMASAVAWVLFLIIIAVVLLNYLITRRIATSGKESA